jgi:deoxyribodipyrimidine photo-lyase
MVPKIRIRTLNPAPVRHDGEFVLYWMIAFRRTEWNFSLQRAVEWAVELKRPLVIFEPLRVDYRWASDRMHRFVIDGMADNAARVAEAKNPGVQYFPYVEPTVGADNGLLARLVERACVVVTDDFPSFFLPRMVTLASLKLSVRTECVDSNGLLPLRATDRVFKTAFSFRAFLQKELPEHLFEMPDSDPIRKAKLPSLKSLPKEILRQWPPVEEKLLCGDPASLAALPIDHSVTVVDQRGGSTVARKQFQTFLANGLEHYADSANQPECNARSGLSPYLHFGHISAHEIFRTLMTSQRWTPAKLSSNTSGKREGWWGVGPSAEAWLDEFVTWRELGFNMSSKEEHYDRYDSLPEWARTTLAKHRADRREHVYDLDEFATAATHDPLWNAAQTQLLLEGRIHNYLRMLWGKKILEWTPSPQEALRIMVELNNRYAVDGRNPNSYSGIFWVLGRYDRPWGPERPVYGTVRYMSSENTQRKLRLQNYMLTYGQQTQRQFNWK